MNKRKIGLFLLLSFGISWATALVMYVLNISYGSITSIVLIALCYMTSPALATLIVQKFIYKESLKNYGFTMKNISFKYFFVAVAFYLSFIFLTVGIILLFGNLLNIPGFGAISFSPADLANSISKFSQDRAPVKNLNVLPPLAIFFLGIAGSIITGATLNLPFTFGEEFGWRGLFLKETQNMGFWKSNIFIGAVWGAWHIPVILMGHNYPLYPVLGCFMMILFCVSLSFSFAVIRLRARTVFAPAAFHGMINAGAPVTVIFTINNNELIGSIAGLAGIAAILIVTGIYLLIDRQFIAQYKSL